VTVELAIAWEYLTGCCVATNVADRQRAEWPPHPARVFMALAAAWFETERDEAERDALEWLEKLGDPELMLPSREHVFARSVVDVYVPVNDKAGPSKALLQTAPTLTRDRQPRTFPTTWVGDSVCVARWSDAPDVGQHRDALSSLCSKVTRVGHSSSLVRMWVAEKSLVDDGLIESWEPEDAIAELQVRKISPGFFGVLEKLYGEDARLQYGQLSTQVESLNAEKNAVKGKGSTEKKAELEKQVSAVEAELGTINSRPPIRPTVGLWSGYRRTEPNRPHAAAQSHFNTDLLILTQQDGPRLPLEATLRVTQALRGAVMSQCEEQPVPEWMSGHAADGAPSNREDGHLALLTLPFVGYEHADGHLLGAGLAFPRSVPRRDRGTSLRPLLVDRQGQPKAVDLKLGPLGVWTLSNRDWAEPRINLKPETWTANPRGATTWASVTPIVLDRFPKSNRLENRLGWNEEVSKTIKQACVRIGLPEPIRIDLDTTSWHRGVPRATGKRRRLRNGGEGHSRADAALGDGFPSFPAKGTNASRPQVHAWLQFDQPVIGPVVIGAGRYLGYGLFKPLRLAREGSDS